MNTTEQEKPLWMMTRKEFIKLIDEVIEGKVSRLIEDKQERTEHVRGNKALADFLGCGLSKVHQIITSGIIDEAMTRNGRVIIYDTAKVLECLKNNNK